MLAFFLAALSLVRGLVLVSAGVGLWGATLTIEAGRVQAALRKKGQG